MLSKWNTLKNVHTSMIIFSLELVSSRTREVYITGCKESQFYSLPFRQAVASTLLDQKSFQLARKEIFDEHW